MKRKEIRPRLRGNLGISPKTGKSKQIFYTQPRNRRVLFVETKYCIIKKNNELFVV